MMIPHKCNSTGTVSLDSRRVRRILLRAAIRVLAVALVTMAGVSCSPDAPGVTTSVAVSAEKVAICHVTGSSGTVMQVPASELALRKAQGDYVTGLFVDHKAVSPGDGIHFTRIVDAVAAVRALRLARGETQAAACVVSISVAPGEYKGSIAATTDPTMEQLPIVIDVPGIALVGALNLQLDNADRALATGQGADVSTIIASPALKSVAIGLDEPIFLLNGHPDGSAGNDITIEGFAMHAGHVGADSGKAGFGVLAARVRGIVIRGNRFEPGFGSAIDMRATSARVEANFTRGGLICDFCLSGPGEYTVTGNRILGGGIDGILVLPLLNFPLPTQVEPYVLPASANFVATVTNNEIRDHVTDVVGVGVRLATIGRDASRVPTTSRVEISGNTLANNMFGIEVEAGFPVANIVSRGDADVTIKRNTITNSCQTDLIVAFNRHTTVLGLTPPNRP